MPEFGPGDLLRVSVKVVEGERERTQRGIADCSNGTHGHAIPIFCASMGHRGNPGYRNRSAVNMGGAIFWPLRDAALRAGLTLHRKTEARQLVVDATGSNKSMALVTLCIGAGMGTATIIERV